MIYLQDPDVTLHLGDVLDVLQAMPDASVDCVVTSPPYWGLRDYSTDGQLGLEPTPDLFVQRMVEVFREVRRVLCSHGTVFLNMGDSYASGAVFGDLKHKDLVGMPWMLAFALRADGWYLRADIIWAKPNPMPESVTDRPTKAHEFVFLLTKQPRYWFDQEAVREPYDSRPQQRLTANVDMPLGPARIAAGVQQGNPQGGVHASRFAVSCGCIDAGCGQSFAVEECGCACHGLRAWNGIGKASHQARVALAGRGANENEPMPVNPAGRNVRSVWEIATQPYPEAHFATYPEELVRRCLLAGCPEAVCRTCGKPRERIVELTPEYKALLDSGKAWRTDEGKPDAYTNRQPKDHPAQVPTKNVTLGWSDCGHNQYRPGVVLDPFVGSGTTAFVARKHGRHAVGIDLNADYLALAARRLQQQSLFALEGSA